MNFKLPKLKLLLKLLILAVGFNVLIFDFMPFPNWIDIIFSSLVGLFVLTQLLKSIIHR